MADQPAPAVGGRGINPGSWVRRSVAAPEEEAIPEDWGWPHEPFSLEDLLAHVREAAAPPAPHEKVDPHAFERGQWYRVPDAAGTGQVYVHNFTKDITATEPSNFVDLTDADRRKLGVFIKELPDVLRRIHGSKKKIPLVYGSQAVCDVLRNFSIYSADGQFLDTTKLKRITPPALEESRQAIVAAMRYGKMLCVYIGDPVCDFAEKVCVSKNRGSFPAALFQHGALDSDMVKERLYKPEDKESGQCVVRSGFAVHLLVEYDSGLDLSSARRDELRQIPGLEDMEEVRCYCEEDRLQLLREKRAAA